MLFTVLKIIRQDLDCSVPSGANRGNVIVVS